MKSHITFLIALCLLLLQSCAHLTRLESAQDAFNKGAEMDNLSKFSENPPEATAATYYGLARVQVSRALEQRGKLERDGVLANALTIKALSEWKLQHYPEASASAKAALSSMSDRPDDPTPTRDKAIMLAMDDLIAIDMANDSIHSVLADTNQTISSIKNSYFRLVHAKQGTSNAKIEGAVAGLENIRESVGPQHDVQLYFTLCQMAALKGWSDGLHYVKQYHDAKKNLTSEEKRDLRSWYDAERRIFRETIMGSDTNVGYLDVLATRLPNGKESSVYKYWLMLLGG